MRHYFTVTILGLLLTMLIACGSTAPTTVVEEPTALPPTPTNEPTTAAVETPPTEAPSVASVPATCEPIEIPNDPNLPPVGADEWAKGPANASVTVVEYGDFQ